MNDVVLFSGGMDSLIAWEILGRPDALYVDLGHKYAAIEFERCREVIPETRYFNLQTIGSQFELPSAEIPMRNLYLAMVAANLGYDNIWLSVQRNEMNIPDRTEEFFRSTSALLSQLTGRAIRVATPVAELDKVQMTEWYVANGKDVNALKRTWACYQPVHVWDKAPEYRDDGLMTSESWATATGHQEHCGDCPACFRRFVAMKLNGIHEDWHDKVPSSHTANDYKLRAQAGEYPEDRARQILEALQ